MLMGDAGDQVCEGEALPMLTGPSKEKSWAAVVNGERPAAEINMPPLEKKEVDGIKRAGKGRLDYSFIFTSLRSIWSGVAHLRFTSVGKGMFLIRTSSEDDLNFILSPGRWYVGGRLLIANQWHPGMPMRIESSSRVRIWIRLPELPVEWWNPRVFTDIAELISGAFVEADKYTRHIQRLGFARIKIEIPLGFCPLSEIELEVARGKVVAQSIEYETKVKYCQKCGSTGHFDGSCQFAEAPKDGAKVAPNAWHLVKVPKRRPPFNKVKENLQLKQNKFEALSQLLEERAEGQSSPWTVLIKDRYCERKGFLASSVGGKRVSNVWHRALQSWRKVTENVGWKIGNGELAKFWTDQWGADRLMDKISASHFHLIQDTITYSVKELLEENGEALMDYLAKLQIFFPCPPLQVDQPDVMVWRNGENGEFNRHEVWQRLRKKGVAGRLPTDALVQHQGYSLASRCYVCKQATEDIKHLFYDYDVEALREARVPVRVVTRPRPYHPFLNPSPVEPEL
ncbi:hypothetical protein EJ110_NYTH32147 [Nymphaea thermarum]|nr:hypothetical protein EJ110_NYTH32147 [Nymphaea thermarum]